MENKLKTQAITHKIYVNRKFEFSYGLRGNEATAQNTATQIKRLQ